MAAVDREQAIAAFAEVASQSEQERVGEVAETVSTVVQTARGIEVRDQAEAEQATEFLSLIARARKKADEARVFLVKPLNDHVKAINARVKAEVAPLEEADELVRGKVIAFRREQERLRQEEQDRLDAERRRREAELEEQRRREAAEAQAAREAAAREAHRAELEAREADRRRREEMERQAGEVAREMAGASDEALQGIAADYSGPDVRRVAAAAELNARRETREAKERAAAARQAEEEARAAEEAARNRPLPELPRAEVAPATKLAAASGAIAERKVWKATIVDPDRVPREYLRVHEPLINEAVRRGVRSIPGVRIEQVDELAVRAR